MKRCCIFAILVLLAAFQASADGVKSEETRTVTDSFEQGAYRVELTYPDSTAGFGNTISLLLRIEYPETDGYILLPPDLDNDGRYSNTIITEVREGIPVLDGSGYAAVETGFSLEAWLPGELVFPPLTVRFNTAEIKTDEIIIQVSSAFENEPESGVGEPAQSADRSLAPLYIPEPKGGYSRRAIIIIAGAILAAAAITAAAVLIMRRKRNRKAAEPPQKTRLQLLVEFRRCYIDVSGPISLRDAYTDLEPLLSAENIDQFGALIEQARFSRDGLPYSEGYKQLVQVFGMITASMEDEDEL